MTCCYVVEPNAGEDDRETARQWIQKTIRLTNIEGKVDMRLPEGKKVKNLLFRPQLLSMHKLLLFSWSPPMILNLQKEKSSSMGVLN